MEGGRDVRKTDSGRDKGQEEREGERERGREIEKKGRRGERGKCLPCPHGLFQVAKRRTFLKHGG